jgi:transcriptional regulator with XRE-family HTH domain
MDSAKHRQPKFALQANLRALMLHTGLSGPEVAKRARVDRKTVNNMLGGRFDPRYENADKVGRVFGFTGWQMLRPIDLTRIGDVPKADEIESLIETFYDLTPAQRITFLSIADLTRPRR